MKSKSPSKQKRFRSRVQRKSLKRKRKTRRSQNGGKLETFQLYFFTKDEITEPTKTQLMNMLIELYGTNISYTRDSGVDIDDIDNVCKIVISNFVHKKGENKKGEKYKEKQQTLGFRINGFPEKLEGVMNDAKLTEEENKIQFALENKKLPFRLVKTPPGLWSTELAIIAFENI